MPAKKIIEEVEDFEDFSKDSIENTEYEEEEKELEHINLGKLRTLLFYRKTMSSKIVLIKRLLYQKAINYN